MTDKNKIIEAIRELKVESFYSAKEELEFILWLPDDIDNFNAEYNIEKFIPGYFGIGSDGGGELLTVELKSGHLYSIPFIPMDRNERIKIADSFDDLIK